MLAKPKFKVGEEVFYIHEGNYGFEIRQGKVWGIKKTETTQPDYSADDKTFFHKSTEIEYCLNYMTADPEEAPGDRVKEEDIGTIEGYLKVVVVNRIDAQIKNLEQQIKDLKENRENILLACSLEGV